MYEKMYAACVENNAQVAVCRYAKVYQDRIEKDGNSRITAFDREGILKVYLSDTDEYIVYNSVWSKLFAREVVRECCFQSERTLKISCIRPGHSVNWKGQYI